MLSSPITQLLGASVSAELTRQIKSEILEQEGVQGVYDGERQAIRFYYAGKVLDAINLSNQCGLDVEEAIRTAIGGHWYEETKRF